MEEYQIAISLYGNQARQRNGRSITSSWLKPAAGFVRMKDGDQFAESGVAEFGGIVRDAEVTYGTQAKYDRPSSVLSLKALALLLNLR